MSSAAEGPSGAYPCSPALPETGASPSAGSLLAPTRQTGLEAQQEQWESEGGSIPVSAPLQPAFAPSTVTLSDSIAPSLKGSRPWTSSSLPPAPRHSPWQSSRPWLNQSRRRSTGGQNG